MSDDYHSRQDLGDHEYPEPDELDDDSTDTVPCPACAADVYEDSEQCPRCGEFITADTHAWGNRSWWWIVLGAAGLLAVLLTSLLVWPR
jgi:hypothetical protein